MITPVQCGSLMQLAPEISAGTAQIVTPRGRSMLGHSMGLEEWEPTKLLIAYNLL